jgi:hypothetical protein
MSHPSETPFDSIENAKEYVRLLVEAVADARRDIDADVTAATQTKSERRLEALRLVKYKLERLEQNLRNSSRMLNDLRSLRRLLLEERTEAAAVGRERKPKAS